MSREWGEEGGKRSWLMSGRWDNDMWKAIEKMREEQGKTMGPHAFKEANPQRGYLKKLADEVLSEETTEVEKDVKIR
jgi:hypothetical protein